MHRFSSSSQNKFSSRYVNINPMRRNDIYTLFILAAVWGGSFLFMRMAVGEFGPLAMMGVRTLAAGLILVPLLIARNKLALLRSQWRPIAIVGLFNSALPFVLFAYATQSLPSGTMSVINAVTPLWGAAIAWVWLKDRLPPRRLAGLLIGFVGIVVLVWDKLTLQSSGSLLAVGAAVSAPIFYGVAASFTKKYLAGADPIATATGSLISAGIVLLPFAWWNWPAQPLSFRAWGAVIGLTVLCTSIAYTLYYKLLINIGPSKAMTVTFLVPVFGVFWGWLCLDEVITIHVVLGGAVILLGTALATGMVGGRKSTG
jgi:drug/metabolite transporter (DMT)-like permease